MNLTQAKNVLKQYWPNPSITRAQLILLCKDFKKQKLWNPKIAQAAHVLLRKNTVINDNVIYKNPKNPKTIMEKYYQIQGYYTPNKWEDVAAYEVKKEALIDIKNYRKNEPRTSFRLVIKRKKTKVNPTKQKTITKNPFPLGLVKAGQFGGKILARRAGAAGLAFGAGPIAGAATTTAGVILTGKDLYQYLKTLRKTKKIKPVKRKKRK